MCRVQTPPSCDYIHRTYITAYRWVSAEKIMNSTVTFRLSYCNKLLYGAKQSYVDRLQCCQNNAARIISKWRKFGNISPVEKELHWLPMEHKISYKILILRCKALNGYAPKHLAASVSKYIPPRRLHSKDQYLLISPRWRLESAFKHCVSTRIWN